MAVGMADIEMIGRHPLQAHPAHDSPAKMRRLDIGGLGFDRQLS
jgi:hypothetical protein